MSPITAPLDLSQCPVCGQANQCAVAAGLPAENCWCMQAAIAPEALERLPIAERGQRCICPMCGQASAPTSPNPDGE